MITERYPFPPDDGVRLKTYHLIKGLSRKHIIYLVSFVGRNEQIFFNELSRYCEHIELIRKNDLKMSLLYALFNLFEQKPFSLKWFYSKSAIKALRSIVAEKKFDVIHYDMASMAQFISTANGTPAFFTPNDAISIIEKTKAQYEKNIFRKLYNYIQMLKWRNYEATAYVHFDKCSVVSEVDKNTILNLNSEINIEVIPNGVDADYFKPLNAKKIYPSLVFTGSMGGIQCIEAMDYFYNNIYWRLKSIVPDIKLYIVGKNPPPAISQLAKNKNIIVTGYVEDIRPYIDMCTLYICPVRSGSGIKNRLLEAMAMEKPIVALRNNCDAIHVEHMKDIYIADSTDDFLTGIMTLLNDKSLRQYLCENARKRVVKEYSWERTVSRFEKCYQEAIKKASREKN